MTKATKPILGIGAFLLFTAAVGIGLYARPNPSVASTDVMSDCRWVAESLHPDFSWSKNQQYTTYENLEYVAIEGHTGEPTNRAHFRMTCLYANGAAPKYEVIDMHPSKGETIVQPGACP